RSRSTSPSFITRSCPSPGKITRRNEALLGRFVRIIRLDQSACDVEPCEANGCGLAVAGGDDASAPVLAGWCVSRRLVGLVCDHIVRLPVSWSGGCSCHWRDVRLGEEAAMQEGVVKFYNETKGFGFITPNSGGKEIFVHSSGLNDRIRENDDVAFEVEQESKGPTAVNVRVI
ncbi:cold-shock protein, partial [Streptomyces sp. NPDC055287]